MGIRINSGGFIFPKAGAPTTLTPLAAYDTFEVVNLTVTGVATFSSTLSVTGALRLDDGSAGTPSLAFTNSTTTGIYRSAADRLGVSVAGSLICDFRAGGLIFTDVGIYRNAAGVLEFNDGAAGNLRDGVARYFTLTGGTVTADTPVLSITQTWNSGGVTFYGAVVNITNTASAVASMLLSLRVGGTQQASWDIIGNFYIGSTRVVTSRRTGWSAPTGSVSRATFNPAGVTLSQLGERVAALINDLTTHGLIGA